MARITRIYSDRRRWHDRPGQRPARPEKRASKLTGRLMNSTRISERCWRLARCRSQREPLRRIANELFHLGADLSIPEADKPKHPSPRLKSAARNRLKIALVL